MHRYENSCRDSHPARAGTRIPVTLLVDPASIPLIVSNIKQLIFMFRPYENKLWPLWWCRVTWITMIIRDLIYASLSCQATEMSRFL
jgi:hypothetical protein